MFFISWYMTVRSSCHMPEYLPDSTILSDILFGWGIRSSEDSRLDSLVTMLTNRGLSFKKSSADLAHVNVLRLSMASSASHVYSSFIFHVLSILCLNAIWASEWFLFMKWGLFILSAMIREPSLISQGRQPSIISSSDLSCSRCCHLTLVLC